MRWSAYLLLLVLADASAIASPPMLRQGRIVLSRKLPAAASSFAAGYAQLSREHYLAVACVQSGVLRGSSDALSQTLRGVPFDGAHTAAMAMVGLLWSGIVGAAWLSHLEAELGDGTSARDVIRKSAADFLCYAPCANSAYLFFVPLLTMLFHQQASPDMPGLVAAAAAAAGGLTASFPTIMLLEASFFAPLNVLNFKLIPATYRPQTSALACGAFTIAMSALC